MPGQSYDRQRLERVVGKRGRRPARRVGNLGDEAARQEGNIAGPIAQGRHAQRQHAQAVKEVHAEVALAHRLLDVPGRRGNDARPDGHDDAQSEAFHLLVLHQTQQLGLPVERQLVDAVEIDDAFAGHLEASGPCQRGVGEGAAFVSKQLRLDKRRNEAGAIDDDEGLLPAIAELVQRARDQILADAGFAGDEDVGVGLRVASHFGRQRAHHGAARDERRYAGRAVAGSTSAVRSIESALPHRRSSP